MSTITFTVPGQPRGKGRPRFARRGNSVATYTDDQTAAYENLVALAYKAAGGKMLEGAVSMAVLMYHAMPKSRSKADKARMQEGEIRPTTRPDADNCLKAVLDGLNGIAFADDKQVVDMAVHRWYDVEPRVVVHLQEVEG